MMDPMNQRKLSNWGYNLLIYTLYLAAIGFQVNLFLGQYNIGFGEKLCYN